MDLSPDAIIYWQWGPVKISATLVFSWLLMALLTLSSYLITRRLSSSPKISAGQNLLEAIVSFFQRQIREVTQQEPEPYLPFVGTLFLYIGLSNILAIVPGFRPPTGSLTTTAALATSVFIAVPIYGIAALGLKAYLRQYLQPSIIMLPFTIIGEFSRTLALAVRLFGNVMSGTVIAAILLLVAPLFFPVVMQAFSLLTGIIQAYIFGILALVYIASATEIQESRKRPKEV